MGTDCSKKTTQKGKHPSKFNMTQRKDLNPCKQKHLINDMK